MENRAWTSEPTVVERVLSVRPTKGRSTRLDYLAHAVRSTEMELIGVPVSGPLVAFAAAAVGVAVILVLRLRRPGPRR